MNRPDTLGFMPRAFDKAELFGYIRRFGVLPRKTFSMGEATEKRYYMEARRIDTMVKLTINHLTTPFIYLCQGDQKEGGL